MRALLLAAGLGTRLRPMTNSVPKCLVPIRGKPLLGYWLDLLLSDDVERVLVNTHHLPHLVRDFVADSPWRDRVELIHEDVLLGTGGTVLRARPFFQNKPLIIAHADNLSRFDVRAFMHRHQHRPLSVEITMMTFETDSPQSCGIVVENSEGLVTGFFEKVEHPPGNKANGAVYIFEPSVLDFLSTLGGPFIDLSTQVIPHFLGKMCTFHNADYHRDIGSPESLRLAELEYE